MSVIVVRGDARRLPLPDESVDLIVTSPPYFALRDYRDGDASLAGQIGSEATPAAYIAALVECTREWARVLKPGGSMFVDLGDKYSGISVNRNGLGASTLVGHGGEGTDRDQRTRHQQRGTTDAPPKSLMLLPERYRIACVDQLGLIARSVIIWNKPNGLPESVTDRVRRSHEDWVCLRKTWPDEPCPPDVIEEVLRAVAAGEMSVEDGAAVLSGELVPIEAAVHLVKQPRYFAAVDEIREAHSAHTTRYYAPGVRSEPRGGKNGQRRDDAVWHADPTGQGLNAVNPLGKLPGSVWTIATEPLQVPAGIDADHFAAYPSEWPRRLILGWSPSGICTACGEGRRPVTQVDLGRKERWTPRYSPDNNHGGPGSTPGSRGPSATITGYTCACTPYTDHPGTGDDGGWGSYDDRGLSGTPAANGKQHVPANYRPRTGPVREYHFDRWTPAPTRPSVVVDPFGGTGTTAHVAAALGRIGITVDLSAGYSAQLAASPELYDRRRRKVLGLDKPVVDPIPEGQLTFEGWPA